MDLINGQYSLYLNSRASTTNSVLPFLLSVLECIVNIYKLTLAYLSDFRNKPDLTEGTARNQEKDTHHNTKITQKF